MALTTRDATLPAVYSQALESLSLGPLWTALHPLLPGERTTRAVPHANGGDHPACPFQFNDQPALRALGLLQEETRG